MRRGDHIVRIEKESTANMALNDAVSRLRGDPNTKGRGLVERDGDKSSRRVVLTRAEIQVHTITADPGNPRPGRSAIFASASLVRRAMTTCGKRSMS